MRGNKCKKKTFQELTENVVEEVAVIVVGLKPLVQSWSTLIIIRSNNKYNKGISEFADLISGADTHADFSVDVSVVQFFVEDEEHSI